MLRNEDYNEKNLSDCIAFMQEEQVRVKEIINRSGFSKYSPMGEIARTYRRELKQLINRMMEDLNEDFSKV